MDVLIRPCTPQLTLCLDETLMHCVIFPVFFLFLVFLLLCFAFLFILCFQSFVYFWGFLLAGDLYTMVTPPRLSHISFAVHHAADGMAVTEAGEKREEHLGKGLSSLLLVAGGMILL